MAKNTVIGGDYVGKPLTIIGGAVQIIISIGKGYSLSRINVERYELITDEHRKSAASGVARGLIGGALLGPVGMLAGGLSAKNKGIYHVALQFRDGKKSLIEINDKLYKALIKGCF